MFTDELASILCAHLGVGRFGSIIGWHQRAEAGLRYRLGLSAGRWLPFNLIVARELLCEEFQAAITACPLNFLPVLASGLRVGYGP